MKRQSIVRTMKGKEVRLCWVIFCFVFFIIIIWFYAMCSEKFALIFDWSGEVCNLSILTRTIDVRSRWKRNFRADIEVSPRKTMYKTNRFRFEPTIVTNIEGREWKESTSLILSSLSLTLSS